MIIVTPEYLRQRNVIQNHLCKNAVSHASCIYNALKYTINIAILNGIVLSRLNILAVIFFGLGFALGNHFKQKSHVQIFRLFCIEFAVNWSLLQKLLGKNGTALLF